MRYHVIDTHTGEVVARHDQHPRPKVYRVRRAASVERDVILASMLLVLLVALLILA